MSNHFYLARKFNGIQWKRVIVIIFEVWFFLFFKLESSRSSSQTVIQEMFWQTYFKTFFLTDTSQRWSRHALGLNVFGYWKTHYPALFRILEDMREYVPRLQRSRVKSKAKSPTVSECSQTVAYVAGGIVCAKAKFERRRTSDEASRGMGRRWFYARWGGLRCLWRLRRQNLTFARGTKPPATKANKLALVWPTTAMRRNFVLLVLLLTYRLSNAFTRAKHSSFLVRFGVSRSHKKRKMNLLFQKESKTVETDIPAVQTRWADSWFHRD